MTDFDNEEWSEFRPEPEVGDVKVLNDHIKRAAEIQEGLKKLDDRSSKGKAMLKDLLEVQIPDLMARCGFGKKDGVLIGGVKVTVQEDSYGNVPSVSAIADEKDDARRALLVDRRVKGLAILKDKAPNLIKHKYEISFDREDVEGVQAFQAKLDEMEDPPEVIEGMSVDPRTLTKWINETKEDGYNFTDEEVYAFGIYPRRIAKIKK